MTENCSSSAAKKYGLGRRQLMIEGLCFDIYKWIPLASDYPGQQINSIVHWYHSPFSMPLLLNIQVQLENNVVLLLQEAIRHFISRFFVNKDNLYHSSANVLLNLNSHPSPLVWMDRWEPFVSFVQASVACTIRQENLPP